MVFSLEKVVPWGRSFAEYVRMFSLTEEDLEKRILGCGDGPASFNAELTKKGGQVVSVDPLYRFSAEEIRQRIEVTYDEILKQARENRDAFVWDQIKSVEDLGQLRMESMGDFLDDYPAGLEQGRYIAAELPSLFFENNFFDIALCSHLLFLYSEQFSFDFHLRSVEELSRVAREVRIFPLLEMGGRESSHVEPLISELNSGDYVCSVEPVSYEFQKGGHQMLRIKSSD